MFIAVLGHGQQKIAFLESNCYSVDYGGTIVENIYKPSKITLYSDKIKISYYDRLIPTIINLKDMKICDDGNCVVITALIDKKSKHDRYLTYCFLKKGGGCSFLEVEYEKYSKIIKIESSKSLINCFSIILDHSKLMEYNEIFLNFVM